MAAKWALEATWRALGGLLEPLKRLGRPRGGFQGRMGRSWTPLGPLLEPSGPEKHFPRSPLGRSKRNFETGFSFLGSPKWGPERGPKRGQKRDSGLERQSLDFLTTLAGILLFFFQGAGSHFIPPNWAPNGVRIVSSTRNPSSKALGALLEASGTEKS